jgi:hypothetical protein
VQPRFKDLIEPSEPFDDKRHLLRNDVPPLRPKPSVPRFRRGRSPATAAQTSRTRLAGRLAFECLVDMNRTSGFRTGARATALDSAICVPRRFRALSFNESVEIN